LFFRSADLDQSLRAFAARGDEAGATAIRKSYEGLSKREMYEEWDFVGVLETDSMIRFSLRPDGSVVHERNRTAEGSPPTYETLGPRATIFGPRLDAAGNLEWRGTAASLAEDGRYYPVRK